MSKHSDLIIRKARENNLKELELSIPHDRFVGITGLSGSGKSSLAFDTIYAEGQRRYIETFSPYTRQFFDKVKRPKVDVIENVRPAIAIQQRTRILNSRSTVGSMTDINDLFKIVWSNIAKPVCPQCGLPLTRWDAASLSKQLEKWCEVKPDAVYLLGIVVTNSKEQFERLQILGYSRYIDPLTGSLELFEDKPPPKRLKEVPVVIDRCRASGFTRKQVQDSLEQCFSLGNGVAQVIQQRTRPTKSFARVTVAGEPRPAYRALEHFSFSLNYQCGDGEVSVERPRPALFSYNHPLGACKECNGFGKVLVIDPHRCVPDHSRSIKDHAVECWKGNAAAGEYRALLSFCRNNDIRVDKPWASLNKEQQDLIFNHKTRGFVGIYPWFRWLERKKYKMHVRVFLARYRGQVDCPTCNGARFRPDVLAYRIRGRSIAEISSLSFAELYSWLSALYSDLKGAGNLARELDDVLKGVLHRVHYLILLGLPYLSLDRQARTLSGGETQRVNLVSALGSNLISTHFVLDEPSVGLHARDTQALLSALHDLTARGNSLTVVEHDPDCLEQAEEIIELGPGAGENGGQVTYAGPISNWHGVGMAPFSVQESRPSFLKTLTIANARNRNLKSVCVDIPLEAFVTLSGVSGSGKSSLLTEVIQAAYEQYRGVIPGENGLDAQVSGFEHVSQVLLIDQSPLSKTPRANIATYTKMWDRVRDLLASSDEAIARGLTRSSFSFNVAAGRCPNCEGAGFIREDMQFLSDVFMECESCLGMRFQAPVLEVRFKGKNVHEILGMTVEACTEFFTQETHIQAVCKVLSQLGLGHITLGHPLSELSGGEAQRLKLVPHIVDGARGRTLFLFDEPTTGLHMRDVEKLIELFCFLRKQGHSIICVEHNLRLIAAADWVVDLGPEGGMLGGEVIEQGTPRDLISRASGESRSLTAQYLKEFVDKATKNKASSKTKKRTSTKLGAKKGSKGNTKSEYIEIRGAREHNLKNLSLDIPLRSLITLTGVSGSGKSTIAKDIIYAEGQRRYLDCLSPYARQFIKELKKPVIDDIRNVQPTICIYQHTFQPSSLSTVATMSEVYNFLRLLFAKIGTQFCPDHPEQSVSALSAEQIANHIKRNYKGTIRLLAPVINQKKGHHRTVFQRAMDGEISEVRVDGHLSSSSRYIEEGLTKTKAHSIEFVTAKFSVGTMSVDLIVEGVRQALAIGGGTVIVFDGSKERVFSAERTCQVCERGFFKPDPEDLSFNSRRGRCQRCDGYGRIKNKICPECHGSRLHEIGRNIRLFDRSIDQLSSLTAPELRSLLLPLLDDASVAEIAQPILQELQGKLDTLESLGLDHVGLSRECATLSNGELQRLRLATAIGSPLTGVTYIFDEPSAGLHPFDNKRLLSKLAELRDRGNTVIQIEHEVDNILHADHVIDIGPGAGTHGGEVVFQGPVQEVSHAGRSATGKALSQPIVFSHLPSRETPKLFVTKASRNNLRGVSCTIPLQSLVTVAGVSGAGKSSLVHGVIVEALLGKKSAKGHYQTEHGAVAAELAIDRLLVVDQQPIGKTSRSTPASYLGIWDEVRSIFSTTLEAKSRGWGPSFFSHNTGKGRCPTCKGQGELTLEMSFLAEAKVQCESCSGSRFTVEADSIRYKDHCVSQILQLTFEEARALFVHHRKIHHGCAIACDLGLGYLTLGQQSSTLSGGESQRLKLVSELQLSRKGHTLYVLDEPTTGLHRLDVAMLVKAMHALVSQGHSVLVIEHDADTISQSDWVIELGPGPGEMGGKVIFEGPPEQLLKATTPWSRALRERMELHSKAMKAA